MDSLESLEASSKTTTQSNSTPPSPLYTKSNTSGEAKLTKIYSEMEMTEARSCHSPLKRKAGKIRSQSQIGS
jgi:hypothetical protein